MSIFVGIRIATNNGEYITLDNVNFDLDVVYLKEVISEKINFPQEEMQLIHEGIVLNDSENLKQLGPNSTVHVFPTTKKYQPYISMKTYTRQDYARIANLFGTITRTQMNVNIRLAILQKIIMEFPEFRRNSGAQALIRDSVLFHTLNKPEVIERVAQTYPIICDAVEFIVKTTKRELVRNTSAFSEELFTDSTTSSEEENSTSGSQSERSRIRVISRDHLAAALMQAGPSSVNSLSSIAAQRNSSSNIPSSGSSASNDLYRPQTATPSNSSTWISNTAFSNALAMAFSASGNRPAAESSDAAPTDVVQMDTTETLEADAPDESGLPAQYRTNQYASELQVMRQMGLTNDAVNLSVLMMTAGNLEDAINLVLGSPDLENDLR